MLRPRTKSTGTKKTNEIPQEEQSKQRPSLGLASQFLEDNPEGGKECNNCNWQEFYGFTFKSDLMT